MLIVDTAGRLHVDEELMDELAAIRKRTKPHDILLVLDAMTGQDAVNVAEAFAERVDFDGVAADQARRRRPRRRGAVGQGGHRQADPLRLRPARSSTSSSASTRSGWRRGSSAWATSCR